MPHIYAIICMFLCFFDMLSINDQESVGFDAPCTSSCSSKVTLSCGPCAAGNMPDVGVQQSVIIALQMLLILFAPRFRFTSKSEVMPAECISLRRVACLSMPLPRS